MKVEQAKQIASKAIEQLSQALEAGHSEKLKEYLAAMARFHRYWLHNIMLIASQKPNSDPRRGLSRLAQTGPLREEGRERHSDSRPDHSEAKRRTTVKTKPTNRQRQSDSARPTCSISAKRMGKNCLKSAALTAIPASTANALRHS